MFKNFKRKRALKKGNGVITVQKHLINSVTYWNRRKDNYPEGIYSMRFHMGNDDVFLINFECKPVGTFDEEAGFIYPLFFVQNNLNGIFGHKNWAEEKINDDTWVVRKK